MPRATRVLLASALLCAGAADEACTAEEACAPAERGQPRTRALLQTREAYKDGVAVAEDAESEEPGHAQLLLHEEFENGTYAIPAKPRHISELQRTTQAGASGLPADMQAVLDLHNLYRCMHGVPPMTWDAAIAKSAQDWASAGHYGHSSKTRRTLQNIGLVGENLAWGWPVRTGDDSVKAWYDEVIYTDGTPDSCSDRLPSAGGKAICHYTQVVWKTSTKLGCGKGKADHTIGGRTYNGDYWVCQYSVAGNMRGDFGANVFGESKTATQCQGGAPAPAPAPTPAPTPSPTPSPTPKPSGGANCADKGVTDWPMIYSGGSVMTCADLGWACPYYNFVTAKCPKTCKKC